MSSRSESCVGMVTGISAEGGREKGEVSEGEWRKEQRDRKSRGELSSQGFSLKCLSLLSVTTSHVSHYPLFFLIHTISLLPHLPLTLCSHCHFWPDRCLPYTPIHVLSIPANVCVGLCVCVCVCGARFHSEILKCLLSALFLSSYSPAAAVIRNRAVNCDSSSQQSSNPILQQYCTHVNWIPPLNTFKFHFYVKYNTRTG